MRQSDFIHTSLYNKKFPRGPFTITNRSLWRATPTENQEVQCSRRCNVPPRHEHRNITADSTSSFCFQGVWVWSQPSLFLECPRVYKFMSYVQASRGAFFDHFSNNKVKNFAARIFSTLWNVVRQKIFAIYPKFRLVRTGREVWRSGNYVNITVIWTNTRGQLHLTGQDDSPLMTRRSSNAPAFAFWTMFRFLIAWSAMFAVASHASTRSILLQYLKYKRERMKCTLAKKLELNNMHAPSFSATHHCFKLHAKNRPKSPPSDTTKL